MRLVDGPPGIVSIDGRDDYPIEVGDSVEVRAMDRPMRFIEPPGALRFWDLLRQKAALLLPGRVRWHALRASRCCQERVRHAVAELGCASWPYATWRSSSAPAWRSGPA